eukprot:257919_1
MDHQNRLLFKRRVGLGLQSDISQDSMPASNSHRALSVRDTPVPSQSSTINSAGNDDFSHGEVAGQCEAGFNTQIIGQKRPVREYLQDVIQLQQT